MTENEAIIELKAVMEEEFQTENQEEAYKLAIQALEEIQQYRAIGTVEDIEKSMQNVSVLLAENEVLKLYQAIGTIDEFKALKEKNVSKKPKYQKIHYGKHKWKRDKNGVVDVWAWDYAYCNGVICEVCGESQCVHCNPDYDELEDCETEYYFCPTCNEKVTYSHSHCKKCNQKLDWSTDKEETTQTIGYADQSGLMSAT